MIFGSHVSIRNGYIGAAEQARRMGAKAFQYFPKNPRSLSVKHLDERDAEKCAKFCREHGLVSISHAPYPTNLSAQDHDLREVILKSLRNDLEITNACGSIGLVVHFGKYKGADSLEGYKLMIDLVNQLLADWEGDALILIENNAGQGVRMGTTFEELVQVRNLCERSDCIGFCLDTCHAFASGLWQGNNWVDVKARGKELGYFDHLRAIHLNDSSYPCESFRDRHANIGKGFIGEENMKDFLLSDVVHNIPKILETPTENGYTHKAEMEFLSRLIQKEASK